MNNLLLRRHLISNNLWEINIIFDMQEGGNLSPTNRTLVSLHPHNLTAVDAETHMSAWKYNCILRGSVANYAFFLAFICEICSIVIYSVNVMQVHYLVVVQKFLLHIFVSHYLRVWLPIEAPVCKLTVFAAFSFVVFGE